MCLYNPEHASTLATALIQNIDDRDHASTYFNELECHATLSPPCDADDLSYRVTLTIIVPPDDHDTLRYILMLAHDTLRILASQHFDIDVFSSRLTVSASDDLTVCAEMLDHSRM